MHTVATSTHTSAQCFDQTQRWWWWWHVILPPKTASCMRISMNKSHSAHAAAPAIRDDAQHSAHMRVAATTNYRNQHNCRPHTFHELNQSMPSMGPARVYARTNPCMLECLAQPHTMAWRAAAVGENRLSAACGCPSRQARTHVSQPHSMHARCPGHTRCAPGVVPTRFPFRSVAFSLAGHVPGPHHTATPFSIRQWRVFRDETAPSCNRSLG